MRVLIVGAGAVGVVLGRAIESIKGNEVTFFVRRGKKPPRIKIVDDKSGEMWARERPNAVEEGHPPNSTEGGKPPVLPPVDTVILAVRADQFEEAAKVLDRVAGEPRIATATAGLDDLPRLRARFPGRPTAQILPLFFSWLDGDSWRYWNPPLAKTLITFENDEPSRAFADELSTALVTGGVPARVMKSVQRAREGLYAAGMPVVATLGLVGFDLAALARDPELRKLAARSIQEALRSTELSFLAAVPRPILSAALRVGPLLPKRAQEMWKIHGPKIAGQTMHFLDGLLARAGDAESLRELKRRLNAI